MQYENDLISEEREQTELVRHLRDHYNTAAQDQEDLAIIEASLHQEIAQPSTTTSPPRLVLVKAGQATNRQPSPVWSDGEDHPSPKARWSRRFSLLAAVLVVTLLSGALAGLVIRAHSTTTGTGTDTLKEVNALQMIDKTTGWAIGRTTDEVALKTNSNSRALHTADGGKSWQDITPSALHNQLLQPGYQFFPLNATTAWLYNSTVKLSLDSQGNTRYLAPQDKNLSLFYTADSGASWQQFTPAISADNTILSDLAFINATEGWAIASKFVPTDTPPKMLLAQPPSIEIVHTTDSGRTWTRTSAFPADQGPAFYPSLTFTDPSSGWLVTSHTEQQGYHLTRTANLYHTSDGGQHWQQVTLSALPGKNWAVDFTAPRFTNQRDGVLLASYDGDNQPSYSVAGYVTHDGGTSWTLSNATVGDVQSAQDTNHWWTAVNVGTPGASSTPLPTSTVAGTQSASDIDNEGYGHWAINATSDGGQHWTSYRQPQWYKVDLVDFVSNTTGFVVAYTGHYGQGQGYVPGLYKTTDSGKTWQQVA